MNRLLTLLALVFLAACTSKPTIEKSRQQIVNLLQQERKAHFDRNVDLFLSEFADSMISVNRGKVSIQSQAETRKRMEPYFNSVKFIKWDDVAEPIIRFSDDYSIAYAIVQKQVIVTYPDSLNKPIYDTTNFSWASIYRKQKNEWKVEVNVSTNK